MLFAVTDDPQTLGVFINRVFSTVGTMSVVMIKKIIRLFLNSAPESLPT